MLTIPGRPIRTCEGYSRRDFMNVGAASLLGLSLPEFLSWKAQGAAARVENKPKAFGAAKSVIATTYFNKIAAERGLRARAVYRGVNPQAELSVSALKGLRDDGLIVPDQKPSPITQSDVDTATVMFAIGCTLPSNATASGKAGTWDDVPEDQGYGAARDAIKRHVERLIDDLLEKQRQKE